MLLERGETLSGGFEEERDRPATFHHLEALSGRHSIQDGDQVLSKLSDTHLLHVSA